MFSFAYFANIFEALILVIGGIILYNIMEAEF